MSSMWPPTHSSARAFPKNANMPNASPFVQPNNKLTASRLLRPFVLVTARLSIPDVVCRTWVGEWIYCFFAWGEGWRVARATHAVLFENAGSMAFLHENDMPRAAILRNRLGRPMPHACASAPGASTISPSYSRGQLVTFRSPIHDPRRRHCVLQRFIRSYLDILYRPEMPSLAEEDSHREVSSRGLSQNSLLPSSIFWSFSLYTSASRLFWKARTKNEFWEGTLSIAAASFCGEGTA